MAGNKSSFSEKITPVLVVIVVGLAFLTGSLWQKVNSLGGNSGSVNSATGQAPEPQSPYSLLSEEQAKDFFETASVNAEDFIRGDINADVILVEYSDLECPFCSSFHETAKQLFEEYSGKVAWVYRHFPLDSIHPNARPAALGAECVASLGGNDAFWGFTDQVFANQNTSLTKLADIASGLGIDKGAYETCVSSGTYADNVENDYQQGLSLGVTGTPGNYIVNKEGEVWAVFGAVPYATLKEAIEEALN